MATKTEVIVTCDLDGRSGDVETIEITINGRTMELDLCASCKAQTVGELLAKVEPVARVQAPARRTRGHQAQPRRSNAVEARAWLQEHGYEVSSHGRISAEYMAAFESRKPALATAS